MNHSGGVPGQGPTPSSHPYFPGKRSSAAVATVGQSVSSVSANDLRELSKTLQELNSQFKQNVKVLTEIKDCIVKVCEKQEARPVDDNAGVHRLERVSRSLDRGKRLSIRLVVAQAISR